MSFSFGRRSQERLATVHPDLQRVFNRAIRLTEVDFAIWEGRRTVKRQRELYNAGASRTMRSRHLPHLSDGLSRAVDVAPFVGGRIRWDWPLFYRLAAVIKKAAELESVPIEWGGDWRRFKDGPHWQLPWKEYP
jgi:peptidoglycan L-alanyl-D-glutamate endopeptidase CwlK